MDATRPIVTAERVVAPGVGPGPTPPKPVPRASAPPSPAPPKPVSRALENPVARLVRRGTISLRQHAAAERLYADYARARTPGPRPGAIGDDTGASEAGARVEAALAAAGPGLADVLWRTVCDAEPLERTERDMGWPARAGAVVLGLGLDRVAGFYQI